MKANFKTLVLFSDRDSLSYEIESEGLNEVLKNSEANYQEYGFSNYYEDNRLFSERQMLETFMFKDEMGGKIINSIIALKSKLFSISMRDKWKLSASGTTKYAQKNVTHSVFGFLQNLFYSKIQIMK